MPRLEGREIVTDTETSGIPYMTSHPFLVGIKTLDNDKNYALHWTPQVAEWLNDQLPKATKFIAHHAKYDKHMYIQGGVDKDLVLDIPVHCTMITEILLNENQDSYELDKLGKCHLGFGKDTANMYEYLKSLFGGKADKSQMKNFGKFAPLFHEDPKRHAPHIVPYLFGDLDTCAGLYRTRTPSISLDGLDDVYALEMETLNSLIAVERAGVPVSTRTMNKAIDIFNDLIAEADKKTLKLAGREVNMNAFPQLVAAFQRLKIPLPTLPGGKISFSKKGTIGDIDHPFAEHVTYVKGIRKLQESFGEGFLHYIEDDGRVHTSLNQLRGDDYGTITGRLSSSDPNLQQIPNKSNKELSKHLRSAFVAPAGYKWVSADWSQFEFRVFAHYTDDETLIGMYNDDPNIDYHQALTDIINNPDLPRDKVKRINLGLVFGMGDGKLAAECKLPYTIQEKIIDRVKGTKKVFLVAGEEAKALFTDYHGRFPGAKWVLTTATNLAKQRGYVKTVSGRRIRFPERQFAYKAGGLVFQGTSADIMKMKLNELVNKYKGTDVSVVLPVHDEFNLLAPAEIADRVAEEVRAILQDVPQLRVPIRAEVGIGESWFKAGENQK